MIFSRCYLFLVGSIACMCPNFSHKLQYIGCGVSLYRLSRMLIWKITFSSVKKNAGPSLKIWKQKHRPMAVDRQNIAFASVDYVCAWEWVSNDDVTGLPFIFLEVKVKLKLFWLSAVKWHRYRSGFGWRVGLSRIYRFDKKNYKKPNEINAYCIHWLTIRVLFSLSLKARRPWGYGGGHIVMAIS